MWVSRYGFQFPQEDLVNGREQRVSSDRLSHFLHRRWMRRLLSNYFRMALSNNTSLVPCSMAYSSAETSSGSLHDGPAIMENRTERRKTLEKPRIANRIHGKEPPESLLAVMPRNEQDWSLQAVHQVVIERLAIQDKYPARTWLPGLSTRSLLRVSRRLIDLKARRATSSFFALGYQDTVSRA